MRIGRAACKNYKLCYIMTIKTCLMMSVIVVTRIQMTVSSF